MKIAFVGATGAVGTVVVRELSERGHEISAITVHPDAVVALPGVTPLFGDANDGAALADVISGHDVVVTSIQYRKTDPDTIIDAVKASGVPRYVVAGGSGTLLVPGTDTRIMHTESFPPAFAQSAAAAARFFDRLRTETELNWTFLSPPPGFGPGRRTGTFRLGHDELLSDADGKSVISYDDYAIAMADEIENPQHPRQRFTIAY
jgi:putative NADH-flavin reductase